MSGAECITSVIRRQANSGKTVRHSGIAQHIADRPITKPERELRLAGARARRSLREGSGASAMLTIESRGGRGKHSSGFCDGVSRRNFLKIGALGMGGLALPQLLRAESRSGIR